MDKLRSLEYFVASAHVSSFSAAARQLDVSPAAVSKLVATLEQELGARLFDRRAGGLALTASGVAYLEACRPALAMLSEADQQVAAALSQRARGTVVVGVQPVIAQECLTAALPRFNALFPEIQIDLRYMLDAGVEQMHGVDVSMSLGWPQQMGDLVHRRLGATSFVVCAAPSYWAAHGKPQHPTELAQHNCLTIRGVTGTLMDLWHFKRGDERVSVTASGWLVADNAHRDAVRDLLIAGCGVARILDWHWRPGHELADGRLVPALTDWELTEVPPVNLLYSPSVRRIPRVRLFIDFVTQLFSDIEAQRASQQPPTSPPKWLKGRLSRASATVGRGP
jgi:LysR family transcriptional regulator, regulator for bpeEF and oprC